MKTVQFDSHRVSQIEYFDFLINNLNIESIVHGYAGLSTDWFHENVSSPFHRLYFILRGSGYVENNRTSVELLPGNIYLIPSNVTLTYRCDNYMEQFFVHLKITLLKGADIFENLENILQIKSSMEEINNVVNSARSETTWGIIKFKSVLFDIFSRMIQKNSIDLIPYINKAIKYEPLFRFINENLSAELKVSDIADFMKSSHSALYKSLKNDTGYSIKSYLDRNLMDAAREYLILTDYSIKEISALLNFKDQYYFSRFFKKHAGIPPVKYRQSNRMCENQRLNNSAAVNRNNI